MVLTSSGYDGLVSTLEVVSGANVWNPVLRDAPKVAVRAVDGAGQPVGGVQVVLRAPRGFVVGGQDAQTDGQGTVLLEVKPNTEYSLEYAWPAGSFPRAAATGVVAGDEVEIAVVPHEGAVHVDLRDPDGGPVENATLAVSRPDGEALFGRRLVLRLRPDASGTYAVKPGTYRFAVETDASGRVELGVHSVGSTEPLELGRVQLAAPAWIEIEPRSSAKNEMLWVTVVDAASSSVVFTSTGPAHERFRAGPLQPGQYDVQLLAGAGFSREPSGDYGLQLQAGEVRVIE